MPFEKLSQVIFEKVYEKKGYTEKELEYVKSIINNSVSLVASKIVNFQIKNTATEAVGENAVFVSCDASQTPDEEIKIKIDKIAFNLIAFVAMTIVQLEFFGRAENDGPFFDLIDNYIKNEIHNDDSGHAPKQ